MTAIDGLFIFLLWTLGIIALYRAVVIVSIQLESEATRIIEAVKKERP